VTLLVFEYFCLRCVIHSFIHSFIQSFFYAFIHFFIDPCFIYLFIYFILSFNVYFFIFLLLHLLYNWDRFSSVEKSTIDLKHQYNVQNGLMSRSTIFLGNLIQAARIRAV